VLLFALVSLSVRKAFHGDVPAGGTTTNAEMYSYSAAWVALATLLLVVGIVTRGPVVRAASALVMALAVGKVFLYDTAQLRDLYRVFSLLGLGASLMLLAYLCHRSQEPHLRFGTEPDPLSDSRLLGVEDPAVPVTDVPSGDDSPRALSG